MGLPLTSCIGPLPPNARRPLLSYASASAQPSWVNLLAHSSPPSSDPLDRIVDSHNALTESHGVCNILLVLLQPTSGGTRLRAAVMESQTTAAAAPPANGSAADNNGSTKAPTTAQPQQEQAQVATQQTAATVPQAKTPQRNPTLTRDRYNHQSFGASLNTSIKKVGLLLRLRTGLFRSDAKICKARRS